MHIKQLKGAQKIVMIVASTIVALCVLAAGGYGIWWVATAPSGPVDFDNLTQRDINDLYRQRNNRSRSTTPGRLNTLVGSLEDDNFIAVGQEFRPALHEETPPDSRPRFTDTELLLTDYDTFWQLNDYPENQQAMFVRAMTKLALTRDLSEVRFTVHFVQPPDDMTLAQYTAQTDNVRRQGGATFIFTDSLASRIIGRDISTVAESRESFYDFMRELEAIDFNAQPPGNHPTVLPAR